jgi:hypothetical protein
VADYAALGWWDLVWGIAVYGLIQLASTWTLLEKIDFYSPGLVTILDVSILGLLYVFILALLRAPQGDIWRTIPLVNLSFAAGILQIVPIERWIAPEHLDNTNLLVWLAVSAWRLFILGRFLWKGIGLRPLPTFLVAVLPELLAQFVRDGKPGPALLVFCPLFLVYLICVGAAWRPATCAPTQTTVVQEVTS